MRRGNPPCPCTARTWMIDLGAEAGGQSHAALAEAGDELEYVVSPVELLALQLLPMSAWFGTSDPLALPVFGARPTHPRAPTSMTEGGEGGQWEGGGGKQTGKEGGGDGERGAFAGGCWSLRKGERMSRNGACTARLNMAGPQGYRWPDDGGQSHPRWPPLSPHYLNAPDLPLVFDR